MRTGITRVRREWALAFFALFCACATGCGRQRDRVSSSDSNSKAGRSAATDSAGAPLQASAQPPEAEASGVVPVEIDVAVGGKKAHASGMGECTHTTDASIYDSPAGQWAARYIGSDQADLKHLNLTVWELKTGGPRQLTLSVLLGSERHDIATVKGGALKGSGSASVQSADSAGSLSVNGKDDDGNQVSLTVRCARFTEPVAEGG
jgi:hypothetical protein